MHCMRVQVCQNKDLFLKCLCGWCCHLIISVSCLDFQRPYLSLSDVHVVSQFEAGQDLHGVQADVDPVGWRQEPSGEETA